VVHSVCSALVTARVLRVVTTCHAQAGQHCCNGIFQANTKCLLITRRRLLAPRIMIHIGEAYAHLPTCPLSHPRAAGARYANVLPSIAASAWGFVRCGNFSAML